MGSPEEAVRAELGVTRIVPSHKPLGDSLVANGLGGRTTMNFDPTYYDDLRREPHDPETKRLRSQLQKKLLEFGGERVVWLQNEPYLGQLVEKGTLFREPVRRKRGRRNDCHLNAAKHWGKDVQHTAIVSGYGLDEGLWLQHSWVLTRGKIYETTTRREKYFGIVLDPIQALTFWYASCLVVEYPDPASAAGWMEKYPGPAQLLKEFFASYAEPTVTKL